MKNMKKLFALLVAVLMIAVSVAAMADSTAGGLTPDETITINGLDAGDTVHLYQILEWTDGEGWTIVSAYSDLVDDKKDTYVDNVAKLIANTKNVSLTKDDVEKIAKVAKEKGTDLANTTITASPYTFTTSQKAGMYVALVTPGEAGVIYNPIVVSADFSDTPNTSEIDASSAKMGTGTGAIAKKEKITVEKQAEEQSSESPKTNNAHDVGDIVKFTITTKIPAYSKSYVNPSFKVTDTLSNGLKMVVDTSHPFTVTSAVARKAGNTDPVTDDTTFTVEFDSTAIAALVDYADVTITYYAKITGDAATNVTEEENTVTVEFSNNPNNDGDKGTLKDKTKHYTFTIDGTLLGETNYKNSELVKVGVDKNGDPIESVIKESNGTEVAALAGATFALYKTETEAKAATKENPGTPYTNPVFTGTVTTDELGRMTIQGLDVGTYYLVELDAPEGYIRNKTVYTITVEATIVDKPTTENIDGCDVTYSVPVLESYTVTVSDGTNDLGSTFSATITGSEILTSTTKGDYSTLIANTQGVELPSTGGIGTTLFYIGGAVLVMGAVVVMITRRRVRG